MEWETGGKQTSLVCEGREKNTETWPYYFRERVWPRKKEIYFVFTKKCSVQMVEQSEQACQPPNVHGPLGNPDKQINYSNCSQYLHCPLHLHKVSLHHGIKEETETKELAHCSRRRRAGRELQLRSLGCSSFSWFPGTSSWGPQHGYNLISEQHEPF